MSAAGLALRDFIAPLLPGWVPQFGAWEDTGGPGARYAVVKPAGGAPAELIRRPQFTVFLVGAAADSRLVPSNAADTVIQAMRASSGALVFMQPSEPVYVPTNDGRPVSEFAVSAITS